MKSHLHIFQELLFLKPQIYHGFVDILLRKGWCSKGSPCSLKEDNCVLLPGDDGLADLPAVAVELEEVYVVISGISHHALLCGGGL